MFNIGKIVNTHGIKGEVKVKRITDFEERFSIGETVYVRDEKGNDMPLIIDGHRVHKQFDLLRFKEMDTINDVEKFKGSYLKVKEEQLKSLAENEYYYHEIIGCEVKTTTGEKLGIIESILSPGANDVWVVKQANGKEALIPYIADVVKQVNVDDKVVIIELMEGLLD
ncbi:ribosome maturation factor RimM [Virgibacillus sp. W0430]|uniref:ribosome maturation factor RimM n=1 Tax=Virgibacillus sp. W0430 TaxID=3391580 RepID=UPI003F45AD6B